MSKDRIIGVLVALNLATLGLFFLGAAAPARKQEVIEAKRFVLVDDQGKMRAELGYDKNGAPALLIYDEEGKPLVGVEGFPDGGMISVQSPGESPTSVTLAASKQTTFLRIEDAPSSPRIHVATGENGPVIAVLAEKKQFRIALGLEDGTPTLKMKNADGKELITKP